MKGEHHVKGSIFDEASGFTPRTPEELQVS
jgi:hypothetical protein